MSVYEIIGLVLGSAGAVEIIRWLATSKKTKADTENTEANTDISVSEAYRKMVETLMEPLRKRVDELEIKTGEQEKEIVRLNKRIKNLYIGIGKLIDQIVKHGEEPCWEPEDE